MTELIELSEWEARVSPAYGAPTPEDLSLAAALAPGPDRQHRAGRLDISWDYAGAMHIRSTSWVGVVTFSGVQIEVRPKYAGGERGVLRMLGVVDSGLSVRQLQTPQTFPSGRPNLIDLICRLLAIEARRILREGALQDYVEHEEALPALRGALLIQRQWLSRFGMLDRIESRFDELETEIPDNQFVLAGLDVARRFCTDKAIRSDILRLHSAFADICSTPSEPLDLSPEYTRRNEYYRTAHGWAALLIRTLGFENLYSGGPIATHAFLLDMNVLFERFIAEALRRALANTATAVRTQVPRYAITHGTGEPYASIRPDVLICNGERHLPVDTKYKLYDEKRVSSEDIYQTFLYATTHTADADHRTAAIVYPASSTAIKDELQIRGSGGEVRARIRVVGVDLEDLIERIEIPSRLREWELPELLLRGYSIAPNAVSGR